MLNQSQRKHTNSVIRVALTENGYTKIRMRTHNHKPEKFILGDILFDGVALFGNKKIFFTKNINKKASKEVLKKYKEVAQNFDRRKCLWLNIIKGQGVQSNNIWIKKRPITNIGFKHSKISREKMSQANCGENNPNFKNSKNYFAIHSWIRRNKPKPKYCEECGERKKLEAANISQQYKRDFNDFEWLCSRCHMKKDGRMLNLKKYGNFTEKIRSNNVPVR